MKSNKLIVFLISGFSNRTDFEKFLSQEVMGIPIVWLCVGAGCILIIAIITIMIVLKVKPNRGKSALLEYEGTIICSIPFTQSRQKNTLKWNGKDLY